MYKKRFTQWGLSKNTKRSNSSSEPESIVAERSLNKILPWKTPGRVTIVPIPLAPGSSRQDSLTLATLASVSAWSTAYFEGMACSTITRPRPTIVVDFVFALKMVNNLLDRGEGQLAGRVTRKAFLMLESSLTLDNPALIWNVLEAMYQMTTLRQYTLCRMLLFHLSALVDRQMTSSHPFATMLHALRELLVDGDIADGESQVVSPPSIEMISPSATTPATSSLVSNDSPPLSPFQSLLGQAWAFNVDIIFKNLDMDFFGLYCNIDWDSCALDLSARELSAARDWFVQVEARREFDLAMEAFQEPITMNGLGSNDGGALEDLPPGSEQQLSFSLPADFATLRTNSITALTRIWKTFLDDPASLGSDGTSMIRVLASLVSAESLPWPILPIETNMAASLSPQLTKLYAGHIAGAMRTLLDLRLGAGIEQENNMTGDSIVDSVAVIIMLNEIAYGSTDPRVVRELWSLQEAFSMNGEYERAEQAQHDALRRIEEYVSGIPLSCV